MTVYEIRNENDAWALFEESVRGNIPEGPFDIVFDKWPVLEFRLKGPQFNSSMTTKVMKGFIELQAAVNRGYAQVRYGRAKANQLTDEERENLQIVVRVTEGSSLVEVNLEPAAKALLAGMVSNMTGQEIVATVLGVSLIVGGSVCFRHYLNGKIKEREIQHQDLLTTEETRRAALLTGVTEKVNETLRMVAADTHGAYHSLIKASQTADSLTVNNQTIDGEILQEIAHNPRAVSGEINISELCRILKVDGSRPDGFRVDLRTDDGLTFGATLKDDFFHRREQRKKILTDAFWDKKTVLITATAKELRGEIVSAAITDVQPSPEDQ